MKTKFLVAAALLAGVCVPVFSAESTASARVEVTYVNPEKFTDVKESQMASDRDRDSILAQLKEYLIERGGKLIPEGQTLAITITEVDMAGDFEPWRSPQHSDVRIVKEIYPPRVDLSFKLTDASGAVLKEGEEKLRDLNFQRTAFPGFSSDELRYEKSLLDSWLRSEFSKAKREAKAKENK